MPCAVIVFHHFRRVLLVAVVLVGAGLPAQAATVTIKAGDGSGNALDSVVVSLVPVSLFWLGQHKVKLVRSLACVDAAIEAKREHLQKSGPSQACPYRWFC